MIKKLLSIVLVFCFTVLNTEAAIKNRAEDMRISKEEVKLESFLNKKYRLYKYTLQNKGNNEFCLNLYPFDSESIYKRARDIYRRDKFPYSYGHMVRATGETVGAGTMITSALLFPPLGIAYYMLCEDSGAFSFDNIPSVIDMPKVYLLNPVKSTLLLPYDLRRNSKEYKKAKNELEEITPFFEEEWKQVEIKPGETFEFYDLLPIEGNSAKSERQFKLTIKTKEGNTYTEYVKY